MKSKKIILWMAVFCMILLSGCGNTRELNNFKTAIDNFCSAIVEIDASINNIDPSSETAADELLNNLDALDLKFQELAALAVPDSFSYIEDLADQASENMTLAVEYYHEAYSGEDYDSSIASVASQYYERAYKRVQYIITFLHGDVPEDENVQLIEE